mmetsp:Transcript_53679/g.117071  ORF Transcript_53679/g.117071 Transcript_53679/m.117071 type:complete len:346 (+) Transcript_53679:534-1571(+)
MYARGAFGRLEGPPSPARQTRTIVQTKPWRRRSPLLATRGHNSCCRSCWREGATRPPAPFTPYHSGRRLATRSRRSVKYVNHACALRSLARRYTRAVTCVSELSRPSARVCLRCAYSTPEAAFAASDAPTPSLPPPSSPPSANLLASHRCCTLDVSPDSAPPAAARSARFAILACISSIIFSSGRAGEACGRLAETGLRRSPEDWLAMRLRSSASARTLSLCASCSALRKCESGANMSSGPAVGLSPNHCARSLSFFSISLITSCSCVIFFSFVLMNVLRSVANGSVAEHASSSLPTILKEETSFDSSAFLSPNGMSLACSRWVSWSRSASMCSSASAAAVSFAT